MTIENRIKKLEQQNGEVERPDNVIIYNANIPSDLERKRQAAIEKDGMRSLIFIPDNGRGRNDSQTTD